MIDVNLSDRGRSLMQTVRGTACDTAGVGVQSCPLVPPATCPVGKFLEGLTFWGIFVEWLLERVMELIDTERFLVQMDGFIMIYHTRSYQFVISVSK